MQSLTRLPSSPNKYQMLVHFFWEDLGRGRELLVHAAEATAGDRVLGTAVHE